ncbi:hypothetical protein BSKO_08436 [Bryopsis sp. KO-2023]|nr:hypothetical protein BSKO_08436 [Bryopsis sp. KO-2023]
MAKDDIKDIVQDLPPPDADAAGSTKKKKKPKKETYIPKERENKRNKQEFHRLQQFDYCREATKKNVWYYRDRMSVPRGPCTLPTLRQAWVHGVIDQHTLVWGQGLIDWLPVRNVRTLVPQIRTMEVQVASFLKKQFCLKPSLEAVRKQRTEARKDHKTSQVDNMI